MKLRSNFFRWIVVNWVLIFITRLIDKFRELGFEIRQFVMEIWNKISMAAKVIVRLRWDFVLIVTLRRWVDFFAWNIMKKAWTIIPFHLFYFIMNSTPTYTVQTIIIISNHVDESIIQTFPKVHQFYFFWFFTYELFRYFLWNKLTSLHIINERVTNHQDLFSMNWAYLLVKPSLTMRHKIDICS